MSLLKSSKTWPSVLTMAFVQLRVDQKGRTYSAIINSPTFIKKDNYVPNGVLSPTIVSNGVIANGTNESAIVKLSAAETEKSLSSSEQLPDCNQPDTVQTNCSASPSALNVKNSKTLGDDHLSYHRHQHHHHHQQQLEKQQLSKQHKREKSLRQKQLIRDNRFRSASIKVDNWDYIYREKDLLNGNLRSQRLNGNINDHGCISGLGALKVTTLNLHYYPESDWGWVIVCVSVIVNVLNHGFQMSSTFFLLPTSERFGQSEVNSLELDSIEIGLEILSKKLDLNKLELDFI